MLSRIYAVAFPKASMLEEHLNKLEEAKKRDHNKIGRELEYFTTVDYIGQGLPILLPKGARVHSAASALGRGYGTENAAISSPKTPYLAKRGTLQDLGSTGITISTACLSSAIPMMKRKNALHCVR